MATDFVDHTVELQAVSPGPERDAVEELMRIGYDRTIEGEIGIMDLVDFEDAFDARISDGALTQAEVDELTALVDGWPGERSDRFQANMVKMDTDLREAGYP